MSRESAIYVAGHRGLVGSALVRALRARSGPPPLTRTRAELDLTDRAAVRRFFEEVRPEYVVLSAARVGGIQANQARPADFIRDNLLIETSVIEAAHDAGVRRLIFFGSTCLYPRICGQPMKEDAIQTGPMEPTSEAYSVAKLAGLAMCEAYNRQHGTQFVTLIPATLYGPHDSFDAEDAHVLSALMRRFHEAKDRVDRVTLWGTGRPVREFLHVDDLVEACLLLLGRDEPPPPSPINVGSGQALTIGELAAQVAAVVGFRGQIDFDPTRPDGAPEKVLDSSRIRALGWTPRIPLREGLATTYAWFRENAC